MSKSNATENNATENNATEKQCIPVFRFPTGCPWNPRAPLHHDNICTRKPLVQNVQLPFKHGKTKAIINCLTIDKLRAWRRLTSAESAMRLMMLLHSESKEPSSGYTQRQRVHIERACTRDAQSLESGDRCCLSSQLCAFLQVKGGRGNASVL